MAARSGRKNLASAGGWAAETCFTGQAKACPTLLSAGANAAYALNNALIQTDHGLGKLVHRGDERQANGRHNQRILYQILGPFLPEEPNEQISHHEFLTYFRWRPPPPIHRPGRPRTKPASVRPQQYLAWTQTVSIRLHVVAGLVARAGWRAGH